MSTGVELSILTAKSDLAYIGATIPHIARSVDGHVDRKTIVLDTANVSGFYGSNRVVGPFQDTLDLCQDMVEKGIVDRVQFIDYSGSNVPDTYREHFGRTFEATHDLRGAPIFGYSWPMRESEHRYLLHADCDMLLHTAGDVHWIDAAIEAMQNDDTLAFTAPRWSPVPTGAGRSGAPSYTFSTRLFLADLDRFRDLLPLALPPTPWRNRLKLRLTGRGHVHPWENIVRLALQSSRYRSGELLDNPCWSLHPLHKGEAFLAALPALIDSVERGVYPDAQAGSYDVDLNHWSDLLPASPSAAPSPARSL